MAEFRLLAPDGSGILGSVGDDGRLTFVVLVSKDSPIRGSEMFDLMLRAFGSSVQAIQATWRRGFGGLPSSNIDEVNRLTQSGISLQESVPHAWTAKQAARWGFTTACVLRNVQGSAGEYSEIDVLFEKPETSS